MLWSLIKITSTEKIVLDTIPYALDYKHIKLRHDMNNKAARAPSEDSDQSVQLASLIRAFAVLVKGS